MLIMQCIRIVKLYGSIRIVNTDPSVWALQKNVFEISFSLLGVEEKQLVQKENPVNSFAI